MSRAKIFVGLALTLGLPAMLGGIEPVVVGPEQRLKVDAPEWRELVSRFAKGNDTRATFTEARYFPFRREPVRLSGEVRVSASRGLSLHYQQPEERVVIFDAQGSLVRNARGEAVAPANPGERGSGSLLHVLRLDLAALEREFELYGRQEAMSWALALVPRDAGLARTLGTIHVAGEADAVRAIELRRSARQRILINITVTDPRARFSAEEVRRFFR